jgi:hypothetical protein
MRSLERLLQIADETITAGDLIRDQELFTLRPGEPTKRAREALQRRGYTWAPVTDVPISRFVSLNSLEGTGGSIAEVCEPITDEMRVDDSAPLSEALGRLRSHPVLFVHHHGHTVGLLTVADLEQPAVSLLVLGLITSAEAALDELIDRESSGTCFESLTETQQEDVRQVYEARQRADADLSWVRCLDFPKRLTLVKKLGLAGRLGFSSNARFRSWKERSTPVRDVLAQGGTLLQAVPDPRDALDVVVELRRFALQAWGAATDEAELLRAFARAEVWTTTDPISKLAGVAADERLPVSSPAYVLTAENPGAGRATRRDNSERTNQLRDELIEKGVTPAPVRAGAGAWFEGSFLVPEVDLPQDEVLRLAREFQQHSVFCLDTNSIRVIRAEDGSILLEQARVRVIDD